MNFLKAAFLSSILVFSVGSIAGNSQSFGIDAETVQKLQEIQSYAANNGLEVTLKSIELNGPEPISGDRYTTMRDGVGDERDDKMGSCTVTVTVSIAGQKAEMSATASTCSAALNMIQEGVVSLGGKIVN